MSAYINAPRNASYAFHAATEKQVEFLTKLSVQRGVATAEQIAEMVRKGLDKRAASTMIDELMKSAPAPKPPTAPAIPAGRYALVNGNDNVTYFFQVDCPETGKWAGWTFVKRVSGDNLLRIEKTEQRQILAAIARNPLEAARRYGAEKHVCGMCGLGLTDPKSLKLGIGPDCIKNHFGITQTQAIRNLQVEADEREFDAEIQRREREEDERVAAYKAERDGF